jgi:ribosomal protein S18 acetylase RimI-like enzyme
MEIRLRRAVPDDAPRLATVEVTTWRAAYRDLMPDAFLEGLSEVEKAEEWRRSLLKHGPLGPKRVVVAEAEDVLVGFVRAGVVEEEVGEVGLVYLFYVLPEHSGRGVGRSLMAAAMDDLRDLGAHEVILWVLRENRRARGFYERLGWRPDGRAATHDYGGVALEALRYHRAVEEIEE